MAVEQIFHLRRFLPTSISMLKGLVWGQRAPVHTEPRWSSVLIASEGGTVTQGTCRPHDFWDLSSNPAPLTFGPKGDSSSFFEGGSIFKKLKLLNVTKLGA